jgi:hypothetical protein
MQPDQENPSAKPASASLTPKSRKRLARPFRVGTAICLLGYAVLASAFVLAWLNLRAGSDLMDGYVKLVGAAGLGLLGFGRLVLRWGRFHSQC